VRAMCRCLGVSASGYYSWRKRPESVRNRENLVLETYIRSIHEESRKTYGSPRVHAELGARGLRCSENRVARLMKKFGIQAKSKRKFKVTTKSDHKFAVHENKLERRFGAQAANTVWAADLTFIWTREGWLYLAVVLDLFSRRVVGWSMQATMEKSLAIEALRMALGRRFPSGSLVHHSDRGVQYASRDYQAILAEAGIVGSMSRKGDCWDNAVVESFFSTVKRELTDWRRYRTRAEAAADLFQYIETWYNRKRRHSFLGYLSPAQFEETMTAGA
jgi:putative transposase